MTQQGIQSHVHTLEEQIDALTKVCKTQADMIQSLMGTTPANLDNSTGKLEVRLSEEDSDMANPKIKRRVTIDGRQVWITANSEQEYAEKLFQMATPQAAPAQVPHDRHNFAQYAQTWFDVFSRPNVETATATTYERQLKRYLIPAFGEMDVEDIKPADVQAMFNGIPGAKETKLKAKMVLNMISQQAIEDEIIGILAEEQQRVIAAAWSGKIKTGVTMVALCVMTVFPTRPCNMVCTCLILITTVYSGIEYFVKNRDVFRNID